MPASYSQERRPGSLGLGALAAAFSRYQSALEEVKSLVCARYENRNEIVFPEVLQGWNKNFHRTAAGHGLAMTLRLFALACTDEGPRRIRM